MVNVMKGQFGKSMSASHHKLENLTVILDNNNWQQTGSNMDISKPKYMANKWKSFGFEVLEINGHNIKEIIDL